MIEPIRDHSADWTGAELEHRSEWIHRLTAAELTELDTAIRALRASRRPLSEIGADTFPLRALAPALAAWRDALQRGRGFVLVRGFPVREYAAEDCALAYWIIGRHLGQPVSQNSDGDLLGHVRDTGAAPNSRETRLYRTRAELTFHTDGADIIGLFCLRTAKRGGVSRIASSVAVYNEIVRRRPDLAALLTEAFPNYMPGPAGGGTGSIFDYPIVSFDRGRFRMMFLGWYVRDSQTIEGAPRLDAAHLDAVDLLERIPQEPGVALDMQFAEGDMQFLKNAVILHARTAYEDWEADSERRHLLRLWLKDTSFDDGDDALRRGVPRHTANDRV